jgi:hypothetical protein
MKSARDRTLSTPIGPVARVSECHRPRKHRWDLLGREGIFNAIVEPDRTDALVGAIVLEDLDLIVDCATQSVHPRDPDSIISEVE